MFVVFSLLFGIQRSFAIAQIHNRLYTWQALDNIASKWIELHRRHRHRSYCCCCCCWRLPSHPSVITILYHSYFVRSTFAVGIYSKLHTIHNGTNQQHVRHILVIRATKNFDDSTTNKIINNRRKQTKSHQAIRW